MIRVGSRVMCLDASGTSRLEFGQEYVVRAVDGVFVGLQDTPGGWLASRFTPAPVADPPKSGRLR